MKRRHFMQITAGALILPKIAIAQDGSTVGYYDFKLGDVEMTVVSGGELELPATMLGNNVEDRSMVEAMLTEASLDPKINTAQMNHIVIRKDDAVILVDAGTGGRFMGDASNQTVSNLEAAGIELSTITHVALTHAHPDHIWGVRDDFDEPFIPDASYLLGENEIAFWTKDGLVDEVAPEDQQFVLGAVNSIEAIDPVLERVANDHEIVSGVRMIDSPGHTPGHMSLIVDTSEGQLLITGDAIHHYVMNFLHPEWTQSADLDGETAVATRKALLDQAVADKMMVLGFHFPFPGLGHVETAGDAYQWAPIG